ncbi:MAG: peptidoglycan-binding protein [Calothrix sp. SM1_7_51]|nr:peptidoglycan-binding protein [Calothrix sp. SM1_7_51]
MNSVAVSNDPTLKLGSQGSKVRELQILLNRRLSRTSQLTVDGVFGFQTEDAVKIIQYQFLIRQTGVADSLTWKSLRANAPVDKPVLRRGNIGEQVLIVQKVLANGNYYSGAFDSQFNARLEDAVKTFQVDRELSVDGIIGNRTWKALSDLATFFNTD